MARHNELGKKGEGAAAEFLVANGYTIVEQNFTYQRAEIDIIAQKGDILAVIEVKTRSSNDFGLPQEFVKPPKVRLLVKAINEYVISNDIDVNVRFDIIAIQVKDGKFEIEHLEDAFYYF